MKKNVSFGLLSLSVFLLIWSTARLPIWHSHMQVDIWVSWQRISYFLEHGNFVGMSGNEILPATMLYLFVPNFLVPSGWLSYATYMSATMFVNLVVLVACYLAVKDKRRMVWIIMAMGSILLFRFDTLVGLLTVLAIIANIKGKDFLAGIMWGLAIGMKIYPVILMPYIAMVMIKNHKWRSIGLVSLGGIISGVFPIIVLSVLGFDWQQLLAALEFHSHKLISIESVFGSVITLVNIIKNHAPPALIPGNGIWSVEGPSILLNKLWMIPIGMMYLVIMVNKHLYKQINYRVIMSLLLVFLVASKNLNPQYLWWFAVLIPFIKTSKVEFGVLLLTLVLNQLVYPIFYTQLLDNFYRANHDYWIYYLLLARNCGVVALMGLSLMQMLRVKNNEL